MSYMKLTCMKISYMYSYTKKEEICLGNQIQMLSIGKWLIDVNLRIDGIWNVLIALFLKAVSNVLLTYAHHQVIVIVIYNRLEENPIVSP